MHKRKKMRYGLCLTVFLWISILNCYSQGLLFYGNEKRIADKSSYTVFYGNDTPVFADELHISFDYAVKDIKSSGYIFSITDNETGKMFSFNYLDEGNRTCTYSFNEEGRRALYSQKLHMDSINYQWMPVSVTLYLQTGEAEITIGTHTQSFSGLDIGKKTISPSIYFGKYEHILDLASFAIRNLSISDSKRTWNIPLNESSGNEVHDDKGNVIGKVDNPVWLINESYYWKELFTHTFATSSGLNFDHSRQQFLLFNQDSLVTYSLDTNELAAATYHTALPVSLFLGMNFLDEVNYKMYVYELNNIGQPTIASLDISTRTWSEVSSIYQQRQLHHHTGIFLPHDNSYIIFGGYGNRRYSNTFLVYDISVNKWDTLHLSGENITPRYFSGMAATPDRKKLYIYGGMGNESGDQNVGRNYYYDLYLIDLEARHIKKLWTQDTPDTNRVPARNMVLTADEKYLYMLSYPEYISNSLLQLYRVSVADGSYEAVGNSIPIVSEEIATNANLFYNASRGEFYCAIQEFDKSGNVSTRVYMLSTPPVTLAQVKYYDKVTSSDALHWIKYSWVLILLIFLFWYRYGRKKRKPVLSVHPDSSLAPDTKASHVASSTHIEPVLSEEPSFIPSVFVASQNAIFLFGNFAVIDRQGRDITYMFSPKLRIIFIYILLHSITKNGVLSSDMNELFWGDKTDDKVKNLKGVTMNNIRKILQDIDGVELAYQKGYFKLLFAKECYCDYLSYINLIGKEQGAEQSVHYVAELTEILSRGKFLYAMESELFDYFKQKVEDFILVYLPYQMEKMYRSCKYDMVIRLCHILFAVDILSELALKYYVCTYQKMNLPDKAIKRYHTFVKDYKREMNEEYTVPYDSFVL